MHFIYKIIYKIFKSVRKLHHTNCRKCQNNYGINALTGIFSEL